MYDSAYLEALRRICQPIRASDYPRSLEPVRHLLARLGNPHGRFPSVVVAGSVGKGTTCHHIARLLRAEGLNIGLFTSPHLHSFRERFVFNDARISPEEFVEGTQAIEQAGKALEAEHIYSTFERATALVLWWFARKQADVAVLEVGLGGRWDAVNAVANALAVFTPIENEHVVMLGGSLQSIAWLKSGVIQPNGYALTTRQSADVAAVLQNEAGHKRARLNTLASSDTTGPEEETMLLALAACRNLQERGIVPRRTFQLAADFAGLPGRMEWLKVAGRTVLIDGGHSPLAARRLRDVIDGATGPSGTARVVVGMLQDKAAKEFLAALDSPRFHVVLTQAPGHRAYSADALRTQFQSRHATVEVLPSLNRALGSVRTAQETLFVVSGSLRMAAAAREAYGLLSAEELAEAQATRAIFEGEDYLAKLRVVERKGTAPTGG